MGILIEILLLAVIVLVIYLSYRKGFLRSLWSLGGFLLAVIISYVLGKLIAEMLFEVMARPWLTSLINEQIIAGSGDNIAQVVDGLYQNLPAILSGPLTMIVGTKEELTLTLQQAVANGSATITDIIVGLLQPVVVALLGTILFLLVFIICMILRRLLDKLLIRVHRLPIIGAFDSVLGAGVGLLKAAVWVWLIVVLIKVVVVFSAGSLPWLNESVVDSSLLFKYLYHSGMADFIGGI